MKNRPGAKLAVPMIAAFFAGCLACSAADWPQFLGAGRSGVSSERGLIDAWPQDGPRELWRQSAEGGMSGVAVSSGLLATMTQHDGRQFVLALDAAGGGEKKWETPVAEAFENQMGDGPRATPAFGGDAVFAYSGDGVLVALKAADGREIWRREAIRENKGGVADYGTASSPLLVDGKVVVVVGAPGPTLAAYDEKTGEPAWTCGEDPAGYSSPVLLVLGGRKQVVIFSGNSALGVEPSDGKLLWRYPYATEYNCNTANPIAHEGRLLISSGENHGSALLEFKSGSGDSFAVREVWASQGRESVLRSEWQTPLLLDGKLYGFDNVGSAGPVTHFTCVDAATGERAWQVRRFGKGNAIAADGKLFITNMDGELIVARASSKEYSELGRARFVDTTRQAPSLAEGRLYLRGSREIVCLDVKLQ